MKTISSTNIVSLLSKVALAVLVSSTFSSFAYSASVDYALGKPATASGSYSGSGYAIGKGNDGNIHTIWNGGAHDAWWQVDLGGVYSIDRINIYSMDGPGYHMKFQLSSSTDGLAWLNIGPETVKFGDPATYLWDVSFDTNDDLMRYIRYTTIGEGGSDWATLGELQAIGDAPDQVPEPATLALIGLALAGLGATRYKNKMGTPD